MLNIFSCAYLPFICFLKNFPGSSVVKNPPANAGDARSIPWSGRSPGEGNGNPLQYACLGNPVDRRAWLGCSPWDSKESDMTQQLNNNGKLSCVKCLFRSLPIFFFYWVVFLLVNFESSLYFLDTHSLGDDIQQVILPDCVCLFGLCLLHVRNFTFWWFPIYHSYMSYLNSCLTWDFSDFLLCFLLEVL